MGRTGGRVLLCGLCARVCMLSVHGLYAALVNLSFVPFKDSLVQELAMK